MFPVLRADVCSMKFCLMPVKLLIAGAHIFALPPSVSSMILHVALWMHTSVGRKLDRGAKQTSFRGRGA